MAITTQLLTITLNRNGLSVPMIWQMGKNMINVYYRILLSPKSMWSCHCDNMDGLSAYIAKRNKSEGEQNSYNYGNVWNLKKKHEQRKQKQTHRHRKQMDGCQMQDVLGRWVKKVKGLRSTYWWLQDSHRDVEYSIGNIIHNIIVTSLSVRWVQGLLGYHIVGCINM